MTKRGISTIRDPMFFDHALMAVLALAQTQETIAIDDVRPKLELTAHVQNGILGRVMTKSKELGWIERTDQWRQSRYRNHRQRALRVWRSRLYPPKEKV